MGDCRGLGPADLCLRGKPTSYQIASASQSQKMQKFFVTGSCSTRRHIEVQAAKVAIGNCRKSKIQ
jgi:hypothetical protein